MGADTTIPFGKWMGYMLADIPSNYLDWLRDQEFMEQKYPDLLEEIIYEYAVRDRSDGHFYEN